MSLAPKKSNTGLILGITAGVVVLITVIVVAVVLMNRKADNTTPPPPPPSPPPAQSAPPPSDTAPAPAPSTSSQPAAVSSPPPPPQYFTPEDDQKIREAGEITFVANNTTCPSGTKGGWVNNTFMHSEDMGGYRWHGATACINHATPVPTFPMMNNVECPEGTQKAGWIIDSAIRQDNQGTYGLTVCQGSKPENHPIYIVGNDVPCPVGGKIGYLLPGFAFQHASGTQAPLHGLTICNRTY